MEARPTLHTSLASQPYFYGWLARLSTHGEGRCVILKAVRTEVGLLQTIKNWMLLKACHLGTRLVLLPPGLAYSCMVVVKCFSHRLVSFPDRIWHETNHR